MNGTRQGDFSRFPFDRRKRYSAVRVQQGRVQLDSDWNEQADILAHRIETATADLLGASGAPAGDAGFGVVAEGCWLELGLEQHFVLVGGAEGLRLPEVPPGAPDAVPGFAFEIRVLPRTEGQVFGCWVRRAGDARFKAVYGLRIAAGQLLFDRPGLSPLAAPARADLLGRRHHVAVRWSGEETTIRLDGETVARDGNGVAVPPGPALFLLGSREAPFLVGLFGGLRLWGGGRSAEKLAADPREREPTGAEPDLLGWWRLDEGAGDGADRIPDRGPHGNDALIRGSESPPRWLPAELAIEAGRYYVDGVLGESLERVPFSGQPDLPGALLPQPRGREREHHLFYLDLWERSVSAIEDPAIREVALGGPDTTLRDQVVAQVRSMPVQLAAERPTSRELHAAWPGLIAPEEARGKLLARRRPLASARLDNLLYRVEIHDAGDGHTAAVERLAAATGATPETWLVLAPWDDRWRRGQAVEVFRHGAGPQDQPRPVARVTAVDPAAQSVAVDVDLGRSPRVEELRVRRIATFKWSRNNAARVFPVAGLDAGNGLVKLQATPQGALGLDPGSWVEAVDDRLALAAGAEPLHRVERIDTLKQEVGLEPPPAAGVPPERHPFLRVWDQDKGVTAWGVVPAMGESWQELEAGIEIRFAYDERARAPYRSGDYWWMPARTLAQDIDWPRDAKGAPRLLPPHGVDHHRAPLALLTYEPEGFHLLDLRRIFQPYVTGMVSKAGDRMEGPLDIHAELTVYGAVAGEGRASFGEIYGPLRSPDAVGTRQLVDRAVTTAKLAPDVGLVPDGCSVLGPAAEPPPGYEHSGWTLTPLQESPRWVDRREMPGGPPGPLLCAALGGRILTLLESGVLWEFDPQTGLWLRRRDHPLPARRAAAAAMNGRLYVAGGLDSTGRASGRHFEYDPATDAWTERAKLPTARSAFALAACQGRLHALGGRRDSWSGKCLTARHEVYDPVTDTWSRRRPLPERVCEIGAATIADRIHLVGGERRLLAGRWGRGLTNAHRQYYAAADRFADRSPLPTPRRSARLVEALGRLYAVGGESEVGWLRDFDGYDPAIDRWQAQPPLHQPIDSPGAAALGGTVYVAGSLRAGNALIEECRVATKLYVHRRLPGG
ncbi:MAG TPA: DUF6519 domain-containing protein [Thermoanaerobaculia bacterium]|jgi:hypothetical protein